MARTVLAGPAFQLLLEVIQSLGNKDFLLSQEFISACNSVSTKYRNGGVHEKIVTYEICKEAMENILTRKQSYLAQLAAV